MLRVWGGGKAALLSQTLGGRANHVKDRTRLASPTKAPTQLLLLQELLGPFLRAGSFMGTS